MTSLKYKLPNYLFYFSGTITVLSIVAGVFVKEAFIGLVILGIYVSPLFLVLLLVNKFFTWEQKNKYFYFALVLNIVLSAFAFFSVANIF